MSLLDKNERIAIMEKLGTTVAGPASEAIDALIGHLEPAIIAKLAGLSLEPVGYLAWLNGKPAWSEDCVCEDAVYPRDSDDDNTSMPIHTATQLAAARVQALEEASSIDFVQAIGTSGWCVDGTQCKGIANAVETAIRALIGGQQQ